MGSRVLKWQTQNGVHDAEPKPTRKLACPSSNVVIC